MALAYSQKDRALPIEEYADKIRYLERSEYKVQRVSR